MNRNTALDQLHRYHHHKQFLMRPFLLLFCLLLLTPSIPLVAAPADHPVLAIQDTETKAQRDARMEWWREARFGMFIHWGLYAVPAGIWEGKADAGYGEWIMRSKHIPVAKYKALASTFNPAKFDAEAWATLAQNAGMKYLVITAKHHDGFAMFDSKVDPFNIVAATPFKRDPLKELAAACSRHGLKLGFYYSQDLDWTAPGGGKVEEGAWDDAQKGSFEKYFATKAIPQMEELLKNYQPYPVVVWFDMAMKEMTPEIAATMVTLLNKYPNLIWNNRLGGHYPGDTTTPEQHIPAQGYPGKDWETCMTINGTWGYKKDDHNFKSTEILLRNLIDIASKGGNYLLNVGPDETGVIPQPEQDRLTEIGKWLNVNGEAIFGTSACPFSRTVPWGRITKNGDRLFLHVFEWPKSGKLLIPLRNQAREASLLVSPDKKLSTSSTTDGIEITVPALAPDPLASVVILKIEGAPDLCPKPPVVLKEGELLLEAAQATILSPSGAPGARLQGSEDPNIGYWTRPEDYLQWSQKVVKPGLYQVSITCGVVANGNEFTLNAGDQTLTGVLKSTGDYSNYQTLNVGTLLLKDSGLINIALKPGKMTQGFCNLRSISMKRNP
jgi:alpha-L-fucosidase